MPFACSVYGQCRHRPVLTTFGWEILPLGRDVYPFKCIYLFSIFPSDKDFNFSILLNSMALECKETVNINSEIKSSE